MELSTYRCGCEMDEKNRVVLYSHPEPVLLQYVWVDSRTPEE